jgi:RimJ/RimL family protein N-acetyltransferase
MYRGGAVAIGPPDVREIARSKELGHWDDAMDTSMGAWLQRATDRDDVYYFSILVGDRTVGQIFLHDVDWTRRRSLIGYHVFEAGNRGKGIGTSALQLLLRYIVEMATLDRLVAITSAENVASQRIAKKCGFRKVGAPREDPTGVVLVWDQPG